MIWVSLEQISFGVQRGTSLGALLCVGEMCFPGRASVAVLSLFPIFEFSHSEFGCFKPSGLRSCSFQSPWVCVCPGSRSGARAEPRRGGRGMQGVTPTGPGFREGRAGAECWVLASSLLLG